MEYTVVIVSIFLLAIVSLSFLSYELKLKLSWVTIHLYLYCLIGQKLLHHWFRNCTTYGEVITLLAYDIKG